ncbi:MAG: exodeoxyribonuclease VII large subunit [Magnetococcales bacterium]|nr:exodeoxyribonuclease VII large subunit [Magnetococcales bacterium]
MAELAGGLADSWSAPLTVTALNERIRDLLEQSLSYVKVQGEVVSMRQPASGHIYLTLIDATSQIRAVLWRTTARRLTTPLVEGHTFLVTGHVDGYPPRGEYQLIIEGVQAVGAGLERERLLHLHQRLRAEGLLDEARKRPLPLLPSRIGVVTSASGAALQDILKVLRQRCPGFYLLLAPATVQGQQAPVAIAAALCALNDDGRAEVILCGRGGGSADDLSAFNSELVVRAIAASAIPVVSAVGHEIDTTLADLVADQRAATPSAAAEMVMADHDGLVRQLSDLFQRLQRAMRTVCRGYRHHLARQQLRLRHPGQAIDHHRRRCDELLERLTSWSQGRYLIWQRNRLATLQQRLIRTAQQRQSLQQRHVNALQERLLALAPQAILQRGYAIVMTVTGELIRNSHQIDRGTPLRITLAHGALSVVVTDNGSG